MAKAATKSKEKEEVTAVEAEVIPTIGTVESAPKPRRGRKGIDLTPISEALSDFEWHTLEGVSDSKLKERWARRVRNAAERVSLEAETTYDSENGVLYFKGHPLGEAPARGRRVRDRATSSE